MAEEAEFGGGGRRCVWRRKVGRIDVGRVSLGSRSARRSARAGEALENLGCARRFGDDGAHLEASAAEGAGLDVEVEGSAEQGGPIHAGLRRVELAVAESCPMGKRQEVRREDLHRVTLPSNVRDGAARPTC